MIRIASPSVALNSSDFTPRDRYRLDRNYVVDRNPPPGFNDRMNSVAAWVVAGVPDTDIQVVINAHGMVRPDGVALGEGLHAGTMAPFLRWRGRVARVWMVACQMAATRGARDFCQQFSGVTGAEVVASEANQVATWQDRNFEWGQGFRIPPGVIDQMEGVLWLFAPDGSTRRGYRP